MGVNPLFQQFEAHASYKASKTAQSNSSELATMTLANFQAFCSAAKLVDDSFTSKDAADIFEEARYKRDQQILFEQFQDALQLIARRKYPTQSFDESLKSLTNFIAGTKATKESVRPKVVLLPKPSAVSKKRVYSMKSEAKNGIF